MTVPSVGEKHDARTSPASSSPRWMRLPRIDWPARGEAGGPEPRVSRGGPAAPPRPRSRSRTRRATAAEARLASAVGPAGSPAGSASRSASSRARRRRAPPAHGHEAERPPHVEEPRLDPAGRRPRREDEIPVLSRLARAQAERLAATQERQIGHPEHHAPEEPPTPPPTRTGRRLRRRRTPPTGHGFARPSPRPPPSALSATPRAPTRWAPRRGRRSRRRRRR